MNVDLDRRQVALAVECVKRSIRDAEQDYRANDTKPLYDLQAVLLAVLVGEEAAVSLTTYEGPMELPVPRSWAEIEETVRPLGEVAWVWFKGHARACPLYSADATFVRFAAGVALRLRNDWDPNEIPFVTEDDVQDAFARATGGVIVEPLYTDEENAP